VQERSEHNKTKANLTVKQLVVSDETSMGMDEEYCTTSYKPGVFRNYNIYQEEYAQTGRSYWIQKNRRKEHESGAKDEYNQPVSRPSLDQDWVGAER
jgi:hypothetical protein